MGVPADHLSVNPAANLVGIEGSLFLRDPGLKNHLEKKVAEFLAQIVRIVAVDCIEYLVSFLDQHRHQGLRRLLEVPRTAARSAQDIHQLDQFVKVIAVFGHSLKSSFG